jgi:hypothetical protein
MLMKDQISDFIAQIKMLVTFRKLLNRGCKWYVKEYGSTIHLIVYKKK